VQRQKRDKDMGTFDDLMWIDSFVTNLPSCYSCEQYNKLEFSQSWEGVCRLHWRFSGHSQSALGCKHSLSLDHVHHNKIHILSFHLVLNP